MKRLATLLWRYVFGWPDLEPKAHVCVNGHMIDDGGSWCGRCE